jgi:type II secretory pathway predicted ATPase ExeA
MKITEITSRSMSSFIAQIKVPGSGTVRYEFKSDSINSARSLLNKMFDKTNVVSVQQLVLDEETIKPMTAQELQVKSLQDKSKQLKNQAKQLKAQQTVQKAQSALSKLNQSSV